MGCCYSRTDKSTSMSVEEVGLDIATDRLYGTDIEQIEVTVVNTPPTSVNNSDLPPAPTTKESELDEVSNGEEVYVALFDYNARTAKDLKFKKGEHLEIQTHADTDWWFARSKATKLEGYIPSTYVAKIKSLESEPWFFRDIKQTEAETLLLSSENENGAFLIRHNESGPNDYSLSVRDGDTVKHYRILKSEEGRFYITEHNSFEKLSDLVAHYSAEASDLCVNLGKPCTQIEKPQTAGLSYNTKDQWEIPKTSIKIIERIGGGHFSEVWKGKWNETTPVAIKILEQGTTDQKSFLAEAQIMKTLRHPKLIQLYGVCKQDEPFFIITELMKHGSLLEYLRGKKGKDVKQLQLIQMAAQVACGMAYLESKNYIHRDLAARNILVGEQNNVKIADLGLARVIKEEIYEASVGTKFPIKWTAPEAAKYSKFSIKSDVWSFGILLMEIITKGMIPYPGMSGNEVLCEVDKGYRMPCPDGCPKPLYDIMLECWMQHAQRRPSFAMLQLKLEEFIIAYPRHIS